MKKTFFCLLATLALSACHTHKHGSDHTHATHNKASATHTGNTGATTMDKKITDDTLLLGKQWQLVDAKDSQGNSINHLLANKNQVRFSLSQQNFENKPVKRVAFTAGCNNKNGVYTFDQGNFKVTNMFSTRMACFGDMQLAENNLVSIFNNNSSFVMNDSQLIQTASDGSQLTWQNAN